MTRYVIDPGVAMRLASSAAVVAETSQLVAPTLLRSQVLSLLYQAVTRGETSRKEAERQLDYLRSLRIRLLGDRVLQRQAWNVAEQLSWSDTLAAEYIALTQLQADAFVTLDAELARAVKSLVTVAAIDDLT
jgi:predicted nucleic acid-binding protein